MAAAAVAAKTSGLQRSFSEQMREPSNWPSFWRSVREQRLYEIEVREACEWLRAAGFPQYLQLFKESRFPVNLEEAKQDHNFLDRDSLDSLCRRLNTLNKCAEVKLELWWSKHRAEEADDVEDFCAISPIWSCDRQTRQWLRLCSNKANASRWSQSRAASHEEGVLCSDRHDVCSVISSSGSESEGRQPRGRGVTDQRVARRGSSPSCSSSNRTLSLDSGPPSPSRGSSDPSPDPQEKSPPRRKTPGLLRKMGRLRGTTGLLSSTHSGSRNQKLVQRKEERDETLHFQPSVQRGTSTPHSLGSSSSSGCSSSSSNTQSESSSIVSTPSPITRVRSNCKRSNSDTRPGAAGSLGGQEVFRNNHSLHFQIPHGHKPGTFPTSLASNHSQLPHLPHPPYLPHLVDDAPINWRTGSFHGGCQRQRCGAIRSPLASLDHRMSVYDNVPDERRLACGGGDDSDAKRTSQESEVNRVLAGEDVFSALDGILERINDLQQLVSSWSESLSEDDCQRGSASSSLGSPSRCPSSPSLVHLEVQRPDEEEEDERSCEKGPGDDEEHETRFHQTQQSRGSQRLHSSQKGPPTCLVVENLSASEFKLLQKLALLKLTALMDKHSPCSKQGWSWTVPKVSRKTKLVEVKARRVFGVPLLVNAQQTGQPLPPSIQRALLYLRDECLDQVGLFRKSGNKSRIQILRERVDLDPDGVSFDHQSAFDVADLIKQYFRDLPEPVFSSRLSDTFLHVYQYLPKDQQLMAAQAAVSLLPDENREALRMLLVFLEDVVACMDDNQMTPTNLAVCLAPSLFHLSALRRDGEAPHRSSHRKYSLGRPDQQDLSENLAATQGLACMIADAHKLFQLPSFWPARHFQADQAAEGEAEEQQEEALRNLQRDNQLLLKEALERSRGWKEHPAPPDVELAFKKVDDDCPLWVWRGCVEVAAPPMQLLHRLLREQHLWDRSLCQAAVVRPLSQHAELYRSLHQDQCHGPGARPLQEQLLLRTWQADPSCGLLYLSSTSTEHRDFPPEGIRIHVHCCFYLLEPSSGGKTRLTHVCRTDTRGRSPEWHCRQGGHLVTTGLLEIRDSFSERSV